MSLRLCSFYLICFISISCVSTDSSNTNSTESCTPSSVIPERREFPVNPAFQACDNFYQYACSKAISCFQLREDRSRHLFSFSDSAERLLVKKQQYLADLKQRKDLKSWPLSMSNNFQACMDESGRRVEEQQLVQTRLAELQGIKSREQFWTFISHKREKSQFSFIDVYSLVNLDHADQLDLTFDPGSALSLPERSYYTNPQLLNEWTQLVTLFFSTLHLDQAQQRAEAMLAFEKTLAQKYPLPEQKRQLFSQASPITRAQFLNRYPHFALTSLFDRIPKSTQIRHIFAESLEFVDHSLKTVSLDTLKDIYLYQSLSSYMDDAYPEFFAKKFAFEKTFLGGSEKRRERAERCAMGVAQNFNMELDATLIEELFPDFEVQKFERLVEKVRLAMVAQLEDIQWLSRKGKSGALHKLKTVKMKLVKPKTPREWDLQTWAAYNPKTPIANDFLHQQLHLDKMFLELSQKRNVEKWHMGPLTVNAYYDRSTNTFNMPLGILQYPFYDATLPEHWNMGAVGMVVGHEVGHAFDDVGSKFDSSGALKPWMSKEDLATFKALSSRLVAQYDAVGHNGDLTLGENIADVTGLAFAYAAAFPKGEGSREHKQEFFLQYARAWCGVARPAEYERRLKLDPHAQSEVRTNEPLKHQAGFYEAFGCQTQDKMFLPQKDRVKIW